MFELEVFRAKHGDALLLHYGTKAKPRYALIDGGPGGTWEDVLKVRLQELRGERALPLRWVMLSHVDDDHVNGLIDMLEEVQHALPHPENATAATAALFHNTPGPPAAQGTVASAAALPADPV
ncbi:MAG: MBL fold metallo-hydrolase, partial [Cryobacterium sp.]